MSYILIAKSTRLIYDFYKKMGLKVPVKVIKLIINENNIKIKQEYTPKLFDGKMIVFRVPEMYRDPNLGWSNFVLKGIVSYDVSVSAIVSKDVILDSYIKSVAGKLKRHL
jgi:hypothetical protein